MFMPETKNLLKLEFDRIDSPSLYRGFSSNWIYFSLQLKEILKKNCSALKLIGLTGILFIQSCNIKPDDSEKMIQLIEESRIMFKNKDNKYSAEGKLEEVESRMSAIAHPAAVAQNRYDKGNALLNLGKEQEAIDILEEIINQVLDPYVPSFVVVMRTLALAYMRLGERQNCVAHHSVESCIIPLRGQGIHTIQAGSRAAIEIYKKILNAFPEDYESRWLLNIAYMTVGEYPDKVPDQYLIPGIDRDTSNSKIKPFLDLAPALGLNLRNNSGGIILEDMNNDNYLDVVISDWLLDKGLHYFQNDGNGSFIDLSEKSGLSKFKGGLNLLMADYDNDGDEDIFVLRGAWCEKFGRQPNSLLRNNGDDTFSDVTISSGLLSKHPTQTGQWRDFNNDGWLDLFIGNETTNPKDPDPCELYINNRNGSFTEVAAKAGCQAIDFFKGVACGDYNNDGLEDIFLSSRRGTRVLLKNTGIKNNIPQFAIVTQEAGLNDVSVESFSSWFWDYNNDGWLDLFICGYGFGESIAHTACTEALGIPNKASFMYLYRNNRNGTFTNISKEAGLLKSVFAMGSNFGDIDNDGYLDMYLGTGNPEYGSLVPNRLFKNMSNETFKDVTIPARVGNIQKGHGVAISDIDNDGDQDIFIEMGGAFLGDAYNNSLYINPGQNKNNWINIRLTGTETNKSAIGTKLKVSFRENGISRTVYRDVNTGGSFGCSSLRREIGIGQATSIDQIEITWQKTKKVQTLKNIKPNQFITLKEGEADYKVINLKDLNFIGDSSKVLMCKSGSL
jgi:hypothetical protein